MSAKKTIEDWFAMHDDGEFVRPVRSVPYLVIGPIRESSRLLLTTKPSVVLGATADLKLGDRFGMVGRYGLPADADMKWIAGLSKRHLLLFLGDLDPPDLMIFAWLRERLGRNQPEFLGISDRFLDKLGIRQSAVQKIRLVSSEAESIRILEGILPDLVSLVGANCARSLRRGYKIEIEGVSLAGRQRRASIIDVINRSRATKRRR